MASRTIRSCDLCGEEEDIAVGPELELNGVVIEIGVSRAHPLPGGETGSWGHREELVKWTAEVCTRCFTIAPRLVAQFEVMKGELAGRAAAATEIPRATAIHSVTGKPLTYLDVIVAFFRGGR